MNKLIIQLHNPARQQGSLMLATLLILLVITMLGMASVDSTGLEMKMSSNSRVQQQVFEAAEYTLSWVENNVTISGFYSNAQISNGAVGGSCGSICFTPTCTGGYCFLGAPGALPADPPNGLCSLAAPAVEPATDSTLWATGSGRYKTLAIPGTALTTKYIIEYMCWTAKDPSSPKLAGGGPAWANAVHMYRITTLATGEDGRARVMLRSAIKQIP